MQQSNYTIEHPPTKQYEGEPPTSYFSFRYPLDHFQNHGCKAIDDAHNLLVCAHTGSGKTVLALYAIARCLALQQRVIYISPIKTLSNQKYKEFSEHFPSLGILTGDIKINPDAQCLIMTAEILRNFIMSVESPSYFSMEGVHCVILDEVHFINNQDRGRVWEEILLYLPPNVQLVMLSATLSQPLNFVRWVGNLKKIPCHLVSTIKRPVPLRHCVYWNDDIRCYLQEDEWNHGVWSKCRAEVEKQRLPPSLFLECLQFLERREMLPATVFLLNRELVEKQASRLYSFQKDYEKVAQIESLWSRHLHKYTALYQHTAQWNLVKDLVIKGIGIHHSGMIPILKEMVEILYTEGLLPVLLATETFALGVNAPTKTVVFTNLQKFDGKSRRHLYSDEYNQMAGRAGRRGLDPAGTIVILPHPYMICETELRHIATAPPKTVESRMSIDFSMVFHGDKALKDTLFFQQADRLPLALQEQKKALDAVDTTSTMPLDATLVEQWKEKVALEERLKPDGYIRVDKKTEKTLRKRISELTRGIPSELLSSIQRHHRISQQRDEVEARMVFHEDRWRIQLDMLRGFMIEEDFMTATAELTAKGVILREIHDGNPLLLAEVLHSGVLRELDAASLVAMLSVFVVDKEKEEQSVASLGLERAEREVMETLVREAERGLSKELVLNATLPFPFTNDWKLSNKMYHAVRAWYEGGAWHEVKKHYYDFEGNFIKNILRLTNFIQSVHGVAIVIQDVALQQKLGNVQEKMIRDIVMNDSLYITQLTKTKE